MSKLFVQVEHVEDLMGRADNYFSCDLCGKDSVDATAFACAEKRKPQTNADRLRAMSDEELADWLGQYGERNVACPNFGACDCRATCIQCWLDWLREEASDEP